MHVPKTITHYFSAADGPLKNLSDVPQEDISAVISTLVQRRKETPSHRRVFGMTYMKMRRDTELSLRKKFIEKGGKPERDAPHYFLLGTCDWFAGLYPDSKSISLNLNDLSNKTVSFTYPDSFVSMRVGEKYGLPLDPIAPYHEQVFLLDELPQIIDTYGLPDGRVGDDYDGYEKRKFEKYIEVQLWSDAPVQQYLNGASGAK